MVPEELLSDKNSSNGHAAPVNPWLNIWFRTGPSLQYVSDFLLEEYIHRLYMTLGVIGVIALRLPEWTAAAPHPIGVMIQVLLMGPLLGIALGYILAAVSRNFSSRFKADVDHRVMRAAYAWTNLPFILVWVVFGSCYLLIRSGLQEDIRQTVWLFEGLNGWLPVIAAGLVWLYAVFVRIKGIAFVTNRSFANAAVIWVLTLVLTYAPMIVFGGTFYVIFRTTVGNAIGGGS